MDSAPTSPSALTSAWQSNSVVLRFIRRIHWRLIGDDAIAYVLLPLAGSPS
jgi:hypothetical protein